MNLFEIICEIEASLNFFLLIYYDILLIFFLVTTHIYYCYNLNYITVKVLPSQKEKFKLNNSFIGIWYFTKNNIKVYLNSIT